MSYVYNLYKKIKFLKEEKFFLILCLLTIHFYIYNIKVIIIFNLIFQLILQIIFFLKIKSFKKKTYILLLLFFFFTILILFLGIKWITVNSCK
ncbi:MAG: hypothetical protein NVS90_01070 [Candidatus Carsonella ruddii]|nr:MAG: hypothetical protein NVS90_01070 [Candidatus Carsonella ruddii]